MSRRYSIFFVTVDTHLVRMDGMQLGDRELVWALVSPMRDPADTEAALGPCFRKTSPGSHVERAEMSAFGVEIGSTRKHLHAHFTWTVVHTGDIRLRHIQRQLQDALSTSSTVEGRVYVHVEILAGRSRAINYQLKATAQEKRRLPSREIVFAKGRTR